jgi:hypothetical protein
MLLDLGFEQRPNDFGLKTVGYAFPHLELTASDVVNRHFARVVLLGGVFNTGRNLGLVESEIPHDLDTTAAAAAWTSYALRSYEQDLGELPDWMTQGKANWELIPFVREARAFEERPRCTVDRNFAQVLRKQLRQALAELPEDAPAVFAFDGRVLRVQVMRSALEVLAHGDPWPEAFEVRLGPQTKLPSRFMSPVVEVSFYDGSLRFDRYCYKGRGIGR